MLNYLKKGFSKVNLIYECNTPENHTCYIFANIIAHSSVRIFVEYVLARERVGLHDTEVGLQSSMG